MVGEYPGVHEQFADAARVARVECVVLFFFGGGRRFTHPNRIGKRQTQYASKSSLSMTIMLNMWALCFSMMRSQAGRDCGGKCGQRRSGGVELLGWQRVDVMRMDGFHDVVAFGGQYDVMIL